MEVGASLEGARTLSSLFSAHRHDAAAGKFTKPAGVESWERAGWWVVISREDPAKREPAPSRPRAEGVAGGAFYSQGSLVLLVCVGGEGSDLKKFLERSVFQAI